LHTFDESPTTSPGSLATSVAALALIAVLATPAAAITLGGAATGFFDTSTAEYDPSTGLITSMVVGGSEQLGTGGVGYYARINNNAEFRIQPGASFTGPGGTSYTLQLDGVNTQTDLLSGQANRVVATYSVPGLFETVELTHTFDSIGAPGSSVQQAVLNTTLAMVAQEGGNSPFTVTLFQFENYDLNGDTNPEETFSVTTDTVSGAPVGTTQTDGATSSDTQAVGPGGNTYNPGQPFLPSLDGLDVDQAGDLLASLQDGAPTSTSGERDGSGDFAQLYESHRELSPDFDVVQRTFEYSSTTRIVTADAPDAGVIPEPVTATTAALGVLALCNFLTRRPCRERALAL